VKEPPTDRPVSLLHVCHSCFLIRSAGGTRILVDPYFGGPFRWKGHDERHAGPPPAVRPEEIGELDGIVITHEHPDHCQPDALYALMNRSRCGLWGPAGIYRRAVEVGIDNRRVTKAEVFTRFGIGDIEVLPLPNKGSEDTKPCMRMSYLFTRGETGVFHGGDSHGPSPSWAGHLDGVNLALLWPVHLERSLAFIRPQSVALMHCDRFEPGDFLCGYDAAELRARLQARSRGTRILAPAPGEWFWPEALPEEELRRLRDRSPARRRGRDRDRRAEGAASAGAPEPAGTPATPPAPVAPAADSAVPAAPATAAPVAPSAAEPGPAGTPDAVPSSPAPAPAAAEPAPARAPADVPAPPPGPEGGAAAGAPGQPAV